MEYKINSTCPHCGYEMDRAVSGSHFEHRPKEGDYTICLKCKNPCVYGDGLTLYKINLVGMRANEAEDIKQVIGKLNAI